MQNSRMLAKLNLNKISNSNMIQKLLKHLTVVLFFVLLANVSFAQSVSVEALPKVVCHNGVKGTLELTINLTGANPADVVSYEIDMGDGTKISLNSGTPVSNYYIHNYNVPGNYLVQVTAKLNNGTNLNTSFNQTVYSRPVANWALSSLDSQCFKNNAYVFKDKSLQGAAPSTSIQKRYWVWGDGTEINMPTPGLDEITHVFPIGGRVNTVTLKVTDSLGCSNTFTKDIYVAPNINPKFVLSGVPKCDTSDYIFTNQTQLLRGSVGWFKWDFGDGTTYESSKPPTPTDFQKYWGSFKYSYLKGGVFAPKLYVKHKFFNCEDVYDFNLSGDQLPENILLQFDIRSRRTNQNDSLADSVCFMNRNNASVCLYNMYPLQGIFSSSNKIIWFFNDPNANPPGSDIIEDDITPCYKYQKIGHYFPQLSVACPGKPAKVLNFWSRIDTVNDVKNYTDGNNPPGAPRNNPRLNTINGYIFAPYPGRTIPDSISMYRKIPSVVGGTNYVDSIVSYWKFFNDDITKKDSFYYRSELFGYGVNVLGPSVAIQGPAPAVIPKYLANQCGPDFPVEFPNASTVYQSNDLYMKWDFGDDFAPACTSFSVPSQTATPFGPPYKTAQDLRNRTESRFWANGNVYAGGLNCKFSFDSLPIHGFENWDNVLRWYKYGHDFPPYDTANWTTNPAKVTYSFPGNVNGVKLVHPRDTFLWNKKVFSEGAYATRTDTMNNLYPSDINPDREITINAPIPDPFANLKGYWKYTIPAGSKLRPSTFINPIPTDKLPDGTSRRYKGSDVIPGTNPPLTLYDYFFRRSVSKCYTVVLSMNDSVNNQSIDPVKNLVRYNLVGDSITIPEYHKGILMQTLVYKKGINLLNNKFFYRGPDSLVVKTDATGTYVMVPEDYQYVDDWDCAGKATEQLPLMKPDALGLGKKGLECPGLKSDGGGDPTFVFDNGGGTPGLAPTCARRTFLLINYDSFADRNDPVTLWNGQNTRCMLDAFVDFSGKSPMTGTNTTPGGYKMPAFYNGPNWNPMTIWQNTNGNVNVTHYLPGSTPAQYSNLPKDPRGFVTVGIITGNGYDNPSATATNPGCVSDTVWYHNFFHFITLDAKFTYERFDTSRFYPYTDPTTGTVKYVANPRYREPYSYLHGKNYYPSYPSKTNKIFANTNTLRQDFVQADIWNWGDGTTTVDSFYTNLVDTVIYKERKLQPDVYDTLFYEANTYPLGRVRFEFNSQRIPWTVMSTLTIPTGVRVLDSTRYDSIWRCDDLARRLAPQQINRINIRIDSAFLIEPVPHTYTKSSWEMKVDGGGGDLVRTNTITRIDHVMRTITGCENIASRQIVIGVIDTFMISDVSGKYDTTFCIGERINFTDSIRYWRPFPANGASVNPPTPPFTTLPLPAYNPFRPLPPGVTEYVDVDFHGFAMRGYPNDSIKMYADLTNYFVVPRDQDCPIDWIKTPAKIGSTSVTANVCTKMETYYYERIYWDFESDGVVDKHGKNPFWIYKSPGRYKISMISRDSLGYWDTCSQFVTIVKPNAKFSSKGLFLCSDTVKFKDESYVDDWCYQTNGSSCDNIVQRRWWFGDFGYGKEAYRSIEVNPVYNYRKNGWYAVQQVIETEQGCLDTFVQKIYIAGPRPRIKLLNDTLGCVPFTLKILSYPNDSGSYSVTKSTLLNSGIPLMPPKLSLSNPDTITFVYNKEGEYYITAIGYDNTSPASSTCPSIVLPDTVDGAEKPIRIFVKNPYKVKAYTPDTAICVGQSFVVSNRSDLDTITKFRVYNYNVDYTAIYDTLFKTNILKDTTFSYFLGEKGVHHIVMHSTRFLTGVPNCDNKDTITVRALLSKADLRADTVELPKYFITNLCDTTEADRYYWKVTRDKDGSVVKEEPVVGDDAPNFNLGVLDLGNDTGSFTVCVWAYTPDPDACVDSACVKIFNAFVIDFKIPNVFTPNGDDKNDNFVVEIKGQELFDLKIYNRWGELVFESTDPATTWNGKVNNSGNDCPDGTYFYTLKYKLRTQNEKTLRGSVSLMRL